MDETRFDDMAKALGSQANRRLTFAALVGASIGALGLIDAEGKRKSGTCKPACGECTTCTKGKCQNKNGKKTCKKSKCQPAAEGNACTVPADGATCQNGRCTCPGGFTNCNGVCKELDIDVANCGACGTVCPAGHACCSGTCKDLKTDETNCGGCGIVCTVNQVCQQGGPVGACYPTGACPANTTGLCSGLSQGCSPQGTGCFCERSTEDTVVCATHVGSTCTARRCTTSADCTAGSACIALSGPGCSNCPAGTKVCLDKCPVPTVP